MLVRGRIFATFGRLGTPVLERPIPRTGCVALHPGCSVRQVDLQRCHPCATSFVNICQICQTPLEKSPLSTLTYADLKAEADRKHADKGVKFTAKNGKKIRLRKIEALPGSDLKAALALLDVVQSEKVGNERRIEAMSALLVAVASDKGAMRESLDALPLEQTMTVAERWMEKAAPGEAAA